MVPFDDYYLTLRDHPIRVIIHRFESVQAQTVTDQNRAHLHSFEFFSFQSDVRFRVLQYFYFFFNEKLDFLIKKTRFQKENRVRVENVYNHTYH